MLISSTCARADICDKVKYLVDEPLESDRQHIQKMRQELTAQFELLASIEQSLNIDSGGTIMEADDMLHSTIFHDLDNDAGDGEGSAASSTNRYHGSSTRMPNAESASPAQTIPDICPELRRINFPSLFSSQSRGDNGDASMRQFRPIELQHRKYHAASLLGKLREVIAEKSFQYSHVIRKAHKKAVKTRSRARVSNLSDTIALIAKAYERNRLAMVRLDADQYTLATFKPLTRQDLRASTAVLDPNEVGSKNLTLSWVWQMTLNHADNSAAALEECAYTSSYNIAISNIFQFGVFTISVPEQINSDGRKSFA
jgi:hypothetical protein